MQQGDRSGGCSLALNRKISTGTVSLSKFRKEGSLLTIAEKCRVSMKRVKKLNMKQNINLDPIKRLFYDKRRVLLKQDVDNAY